MAKHKPASDTRDRLDALRGELHELYAKVEKTGSTAQRIEEIVSEITKIQEAQ